jgi:hypothetical protein
MKQLSVLSLLCGVLPLASAPGDWTALPTPRLCEPRAAETHPAPLSSGSHLLSPSERLPVRGTASTARLPMPTLVKILEDDVRGRGGRIEFFKSSSELLARGDPAALEAARARIGELERAMETLSIDLEVDLAGSPSGGTGAGKGAVERWTAKRRTLSGEETFFGQRKTSTFVMSFDVEVAADSGIAAPVLGTAAFGRTLHVRAARVDAGKRVHLEGLLDLSELSGVERFDPETPDLGVIQEPALDFVQIAFAGVVDSGGTLEVEVAGAPLSRPDWKLTVRASTHADDPSPKDGVLDVLDLAFLASDPVSLPVAGPGAELENQAPFVQPPHLPAAIPPSAIAAALDARAGDGSAPRPSTWWSDDLLILQRSDTQARAEARSLVAAAETARLSTCRIEARRGTLSARFPACAGSPARWLAGRERTALVGYRAEIAPQTWMAAPDVQKAFDGLALAVEALPGAAQCSLWIAESAAGSVVARADAQLGKLQLLSRGLRAERARLATGEPERALAGLPAGDAGAPDAVILRCLAP